VELATSEMLLQTSPYKNKETESVVREWLRIQHPNVRGKWIIKFVSGCNKQINILGHYAEKWRYFTAMYNPQLHCKDLSFNFYETRSFTYSKCRFQWSRGLRRSLRPLACLRFWVRIPPEAWMFVSCDCCVLSGRSLCDGLIIRPEESYRLWRVVCDQETSKTRRLKPATGLLKYNHNGL
jgi:hypothetical protein